jgi:hypothetical protein
MISLRSIICNILDANAMADKNGKLSVEVSITPIPTRHPEGTVPGYWAIYLEKNGNNEYYYEGWSPFTTFENVTPGEYTCYGVRLNTDGNQIGGLVYTDVDLKPTIIAE